MSPRTEAGRLLLEKNTSRDTATNEWLLNDILAIEVEAAQGEGLRIWERLRAMGPRPVRLAVIQAVCLSSDSSPPTREPGHVAPLPERKRVA
jgi:hypothetical protein